MDYGGTKCLQCGSNGMPNVTEESKATARACQNCGFVELLRQVIKEQGKGKGK